MPREGRACDDLTPFSMPHFALEQHDNSLRISTAQLRLDVTLDDLQLSWSDAHGNSFEADLPGRAFPCDRTGKTIFHYLERRAEEHYYGFGERSGLLVKKGRRMRMLNCV